MRSLFDSREAASAWRGQAAQRAAFQQPVTELMLDRARIGPGTRVLDIGTGTGDTAVLAADRVGKTGHVLAIDRSSEMINAAREIAKEAALNNIEALVMDGGRLEVEPAAFDAVIGRHSVQFLDAWPAPLTGFLRALRPDGRLSFVVWGRIEQNPFTALPITVARDLGWLETTSDVFAPFSLDDPDRLAADLRTACFRDVEVEPIPFTAALSFEAALANRLDSALSYLVLASIGPDRRPELRNAMSAALERMRDGDQAVVSGLTLLASASR
jgi:SAM-dependent methyltransferase